MSTWSSPVRYAECDQQGVAFHGQYLTWADEASTALMVRTGLTYQELLRRGLDTSVVGCELSWTSPARWEDVVEVDGTVERLGRTSFVFAFVIRVGDRVCCRVRNTYVLTRDGRPTALPEDVRERWAVTPAVTPAAAPAASPAR